MKPVYIWTKLAPHFNFSITSLAEKTPPTPIIGKDPLLFLWINLITSLLFELSARLQMDLF